MEGDVSCGKRSVSVSYLWCLDQVDVNCTDGDHIVNSAYEADSDDDDNTLGSDLQDLADQVRGAFGKKYGLPI